MSGVVSSLVSPVNILPGTYSVMADQGTTGGLPVPTLDLVGAYARVTDLFGNATDLVLCYAFGTQYRWKPVRNDGYNQYTLAGGSSLILQPLRTGPLVRAVGTISGVAAGITPAVAGAWPGMQYDIMFTGVLNLVGLNLNGVVGGTIPLLSGTKKTIVFNGTAWEYL